MHDSVLIWIIFALMSVCLFTIVPKYLTNIGLIVVSSIIGFITFGFFIIFY